MNEYNEFRLLMKQNYLKSKSLNGEYKDAYTQLTKELSDEVQKGTAMANALSDIADLLIEAQRDGRPVSDVMGENREDFYNSIVQTLPHFTREEKRVRKDRKRQGITAVAIATALIITSTLLYFSGLFSYWTTGMYFIMNRADLYTVNHQILQDKEYRMDIDLSKKDSYKDMLIAGHEGGKIYIHSINTQSKDYIIWFYSKTDYSLKGMNFLSGTKYEMTPEHAYTYYVVANMTTEFKGKIYNGSVAGCGSMGSKDKEMFGFYLISGAANNNIQLTDKDKITIILKNLCMSYYARK